jgi:hypothetical protein
MVIDIKNVNLSLQHALILLLYHFFLLLKNEDLLRSHYLHTTTIFFIAKTKSGWAKLKGIFTQ